MYNRIKKLVGEVSLSVGQPVHSVGHQELRSVTAVAGQSRPESRQKYAQSVYLRDKQTYIYICTYICGYRDIYIYTSHLAK